MAFHNLRIALASSSLCTRVQGSRDQFHVSSRFALLSIESHRAASARQLDDAIESALRIRRHTHRQDYKSVDNTDEILHALRHASFREREIAFASPRPSRSVSYTHLRAHETRHDL